MLLLPAGLWLAIGGTQLISLGGSPYYLIAGSALLVTAALLARGRRAAVWLYVAIVVATAAWTFAEVQVQRWGVLARLGGPLILLALLLAIAPGLRAAAREPRIPALAFRLGALVSLCIPLALMFAPVAEPTLRASLPAATASANRFSDWPSYGGNDGGQRYSGLSQIDAGNVAALEPAWTFRTGGLDNLGHNSRVTATPIKIGNMLYVCTPLNVVIAIDATTGRERWRFDPQVDAGTTFSIVCRGVSFARSASAIGPCSERILFGTLDARLFALDARTGQRCAGFGENGAVNLLPGINDRRDGYYYVTSPPTIVGRAAIIGGYIIDNQRVSAPRGVVRAFDTKSGALLWAWDAGRPGGAPLAEGEFYSAGNPNAWAVFSADPTLGLVYVPTGNSSPDFYGVLRTPAAERYSTSIVALDASTGQLRWSFQAVHHDLWDYDMPAQPTLIDLPGATGPIPALLAPAKTGEIFMLDRRTGKPVAAVTERAVPQGSVPGERLSPTQPVSSLPSFAPPTLREADLWGATPLDMLACRIRFRSVRYEGAFTPLTERETMMTPGTFGTLNWGGVSVDAPRGVMIVNSSAMPFVGRLVPRPEADARGAAPYGETPRIKPADGVRPPMAQQGTPYGLELAPFLSPIGLPCQAPPWGMLTAVDIKSRTRLWERPFGTSKGLAPLGLALPVGIFNLGGSITTAGGIIFIGATTDGSFRAFETASGRELWRSELPAGGQATPMTYLGQDGRQYVVIFAGGHGSLRTKRGDHLVAFALPRGEEHRRL
ncbi:membrane-bound PQQ-dependent dehydrogenase, glucose/quinate/shikimate family [Sphingoaurantiacus capsulatus]|uniref:Membrane-bound PQQ-dependent dehydrogenase, glucose/quinate/shikimate family n=1 Tax=Sphingoaurantiacus capsulatus TaxID=1771310 RepID=A0ABV7XAR5_9SPHN